jgi:hypothetical protein
MLRWTDPFLSTSTINRFLIVVDACGLEQIGRMFLFSFWIGRSLEAWDKLRATDGDGVFPLECFATAINRFFSVGARVYLAGTRSWENFVIVR